MVKRQCIQGANAWLAHIAVFTAFCLAISGCGSNGAATVEGKVTWEGQPLTEGNVRFVPADGKGQTASADVKDGAFTIAVPPGQWRVEFSAPKVVGKIKMIDAPDAPTVDDVRELLPPMYNVQSKLTADVQPGTQEIPFDLVKQGKK
ncbi:MAG: hypothetical protein R3E01_21630 [Pirellulaceae bacterium]|nr:carboxypeptidase regulatory-like domain-containing protein [Planctomycetales bacterium]